MISRTYVNGVIAAKEKYFLGEKLLRLTEKPAAITASSRRAATVS